MKLKNLLYLFLFIFSSFAFSSCSSGQYYTFSGSSASYHSTKSFDKKLAPEDRYARDNEFSPTENPDYSYTESKTEVITASTGKAVPLSRPVINITNNITGVSQENAQQYKAEAVTTDEHPVTKKQVKKLQKKEQTKKPFEIKAVPLLAKVIIALFIPPLAVFLHSGLGSQFWISLLLTLLFFLPGVIYALLVVTDTI